MGVLEVTLIGISLSMDAFAVSLCKGLNMKKLNLKDSVIISLFFGVFQALMPLLGWFCGSLFEKYINKFDHWVAFVLLVLIGAKMIYDVIIPSEDKKNDDKALDIKELFILAIATSIDALAVGISFAFLPVNIVSAISIIGISTFILSLIGVVIGHKFGAAFKDKAAFCGGLVLILIGLKILLEGLGIINF